METTVTAMFVEEPTKLGKLKAVYAGMSRSALTPQQSADLTGRVAGRVAVRDSKDRQGPTFVSTQDEWAGFITGIREGAFDQ